MDSFWGILFSLLIGIILVTEAETTSKEDHGEIDQDIPEVKLFYESMCPGCRRFDSTYFAKLVSTLGPHLHIQTFPYGKASTTIHYNGSTEFTCQHGPAECYGNTLHACALNTVPDRDTALLFNACLMHYDRALNGSDDHSADEMPKRSRPEVKLYYESMCPACRAFDSSVFSQMVSLLGPFIDIITYPYGKATTIMRPDGSLDFVCQHGPNECYGNKLHACALDVIQPRDQALQFNACMMRPERPGNGSNDASAEECGALLRVNANAIKQCAKGQRGALLLKSYGEQTGLVDLQFVPHVEINGQFWRGQYENFMKDVCAAFTNPPAVCSGII